jgi:acetylornithine deacetylase/succinyl-diaminopimelate desuccinylase-like protein
MFTTATATARPLQHSQQPEVRSRWLTQITELIAFPTISAQPQHRKDIQACAQWLARHLAEIGLHHIQILPGINGSPPSIYADWLQAPNKPTLLLYGHYDVQPIDPIKAWTHPPFQATILGDNLHARGASDDKGQLFIHLKAIESYLRTTGKLPLNIKIWLEGEEEIGSPNLAAFLDREATRLQANAVLVSDTDMLGPNKPSIIYGLRGNLNCELKIRGPKTDLHSGRYGGAVLNPLQALSATIAGLHDRQNRITIPGFYRNVRPLPPTDRQEIRCCNKRDKQILTELNLPAGWGEAGYNLLERMTIRPALTINGIAGGYVGPGSKSIIPSQGIARFSFRLVPDQTPQEIAQLIQQYITATTHPAIQTQLTVSSGAPPVLLPRNNPAMQAAYRAVTQAWGTPPVFTRSGGSIPFVAQLYRSLQVPIVLLGFGLPDDNIHAPNEKMNLTNFFRGIETIICLLAEYGKNRQI